MIWNVLMSNRLIFFFLDSLFSLMNNLEIYLKNLIIAPRGTSGWR